MLRNANLQEPNLELRRVSSDVSSSSFELSSLLPFLSPTFTLLPKTMPTERSRQLESVQPEADGYLQQTHQTYQDLFYFVGCSREFVPILSSPPPFLDLTSPPLPAPSTTSANPLLLLPQMPNHPLTLLPERLPPKRRRSSSYQKQNRTAKESMLSSKVVLPSLPPPKETMAMGDSSFFLPRNHLRGACFLSTRSLRGSWLSTSSVGRRT